jgi:hypothetical protein
MIESENSFSSLLILCILQGIILSTLLIHWLLKACIRQHLFFRGKSQPYIYASSSIQEFDQQHQGGGGTCNLFNTLKFNLFNTLKFAEPRALALYSSGNVHQLRHIKHNGETETINFEFDVIVPYQNNNNNTTSQPLTGLVSGRVVSLPLALLSSLVDKINHEVLLPKYLLKTTKQRKFGEVTSPFSLPVLALTTLFALFPLILLITNVALGSEMLPSPLVTGLAFITVSGFVMWFYLAISYIIDRREVGEYLVSLIPELSRYLSQSRDVHFLLVSKSVDVSIRVSKAMLWTNVDLVATVANTSAALSRSTSPATIRPYLSIRTSVIDEPQSTSEAIDEDDPAVVDVSRSNSVNPRTIHTLSTSATSSSPRLVVNTINNL